MKSGARAAVGGMAIAVLGIASPGSASAQTKGFAVNLLEPSERGSDWFALESLDLRGNGRPALGVVADYQLRPLAIYNPDGTVRSSPLEHVMTTHVGASFTVGDRLRIGASLPLVVYETGDTGRLGSVVVPPPTSDQAVGDIRLGVDLRLFGEHDGPAGSAAALSFLRRLVRAQRQSPNTLPWRETGPFRRTG